jgi:hypothetical protein
MLGGGEGAQLAGKPYVGPMTSVLAILLAIVMLAILGVLGAGMVGLVQGGTPRRSNALMRARVLLQAVALALLALLLLTRHN